ncbi:hypothetical protein MARCHEWKA_00580 [Brevundimonas phage vB_BpoS-Marchewka]|uniref:Uncharacterized protein n=1 Tax=Brevundimonas phage vB_BpoS-Marchewka TaxID=2948604 RepID=A0A9E7N2A8_9CAUD|nr:hypothetical protein MARCHEWKA_00580 [Brevundimonas phage vB_BpoS-Marchewka]
MAGAPVFDQGSITFLVGLTFVGAAVALAFLGAVVGAIFSLPFALWQHDFTVMILPVSIFSAIPPVAAGLYLLAEWLFAKFA